MTVDDVIKIILAVGVTFSLVGISFQIMRLLGKLTSSLDDLKKALQNVSEASDMILEDYDDARDSIRSIISGFKGFSDILTPLRYIANLASRKDSKSKKGK